MKETSLVLVLLLFIQCSMEAAKVEEISVDNDHLISSSLLQKFNRTLTGSFSGLIFQSGQERTLYEIEVHKIVYKTKTVDGKETEASGAVMFPRLDQSLPLVSYQHGTITEESSAPSNISRFGLSEMGVMAIFASPIITLCVVSPSRA